MRIISLILCFTLSLCLYSNNQIKANSQIGKILETKEGTERLQSLLELGIKRYMYQDAKNIAEILEKEAIIQNNNRYLYSAYALKSNYYLQNNNKDSTAYYIAKSKEILGLDNSEFFIAGIDESQIYSLVQQGKHELALFYIDRYLKNRPRDTSSELIMRVDYVVGYSYLYSSRYEEAKQVFLDVLANYKLEQPRDKKFEFTIYHAIADASRCAKDYNLSFVACDSMDVILNHLQDNCSHEELVPMSFILNIDKANAFIGTKQLDKAKKILDTIAQLPEAELNIMLKASFYSTQAHYYYEIGEYNKAEPYLNPIIDFMRGKDSYNFLEESLFKTKVLHAQNKNKEAYKLLDSLYTYKDSINTINFASQIAELQTVYEVDNMKLKIDEGQKILEKNKLLIIILCISTFLLLVIVVIMKRHSSILKRKNLKLYQQSTEIERIIQQRRKVYETDMDSEENILSLADRIDSYLDEFKNFKDPNLSRETLANLVGTNRQYLLEAIKIKKGMTYSEYINEKRLQYAKDRLIENCSDSIIDIISESGFSSRSTFNRLFKSRYSMTPNEMRNAILFEKEQNNINE